LARDGSRQKILIDTDPGMGTAGADPEDSFAIMLALASPEVEVVAITAVAGNVPLVNAYSNLVHLLALLGRTDVPVAPGFAEPLMPQRRGHHARVLGFLARGPQIAPLLDVRSSENHAVDLIVDTVCRSDEPVTIVAIGPLTNVAAAILREPRVAEKAGGLAIMGGAVGIAGNVTPAAEFNIWVDPEAADIVFRSGIPIKLVTLDVCHQTLMKVGELESVSEGTDLGAFVREATFPWIKRMRSNGLEGFHLFDSLTLASTFRPQLIGTVPAWVDVETQGRWTSGQTVAYLTSFAKEVWVGDRTNCDVSVDLFDNAGFTALYNDRVLKPLRE
jgi:inosine-uridine nucleoside N-ribohydrolase